MKNMINELIAQLGPDKVLTGEALQERYTHVWTMNIPLRAKAVVLPHRTEEVAAILKICHRHQQPVIVHGGLTNLVGSTETHEDEVVIAMEKMNAIEEVDKQSRTMTVQAGAILENIQQGASEKDLLFPMNFGAKGSAQIGGIISTNAGGLRVFRYGMMRHLVLGLEVVLADGTILSSLKKIIKDNSAYDLKQLFIGSEGTLGIVTKAVIKLVEAPKSRTSAFVALHTFDKVVSFLKYMDRNMAGTLSGYELIWGNTYQSMTSPPALQKPPLPHGFAYYVLLEGLGAQPENDHILLENLLAEAFEKEMIEDAAIATTDSELEWFWKIREDVHTISSQCNHDQHFDISLPISKIGKTIASITTQLHAIPEVEKVFAFGHVADGNIHFIIGKSEHTPRVVRAINDTVYGPLKALGGSVSAEHGIGVHKKAYLHLCRTEEEIAFMKQLKVMMDPIGILNRGKVFD